MWPSCTALHSCEHVCEWVSFVRNDDALRICNTNNIMIWLFEEKDEDGDENVVGSGWMVWFGLSHVYKLSCIVCASTVKASWAFLHAPYNVGRYDMYVHSSCLRARNDNHKDGGSGNRPPFFVVLGLDSATAWNERAAGWYGLR